MTQPSRRAYLSGVGAAISAVVAGCADTIGEGGRPSSTETGAPRSSTTTTDDSTDALQAGEEFTTADGVSITISNPEVHRSVVTTEKVSHHTYEVVEYAPTGQFLVVQVGTTGTRTAPVELPLNVVADGKSGIGTGRIHVGGKESTRVGFRVPRIDAQSVDIVWEGGGSTVQWRLDSEVASALGAVPAFEVTSWSVPDTVTRGEAFDASFTVTNHGDRDGRFLTTFDAEIGSLGTDEVSTMVAAGETKTGTYSIRPTTYSGIQEFRVVLDWGAGRKVTWVTVTDG